MRTSFPPMVPASAWATLFALLLSTGRPGISVASTGSTRQGSATGSSHSAPEWLILDEEGAFAVQAGTALPTSLPKPDAARLVPPSWRAAGLPAALTLVDHVNLADSTDAMGHGLNDTASSKISPAPSRVLDLNGESYRVTNHTDGFDVRTFSVRMKCDTTPGTPNVLVVRVPEDRPRFPVITVTMPGGMPWAAPYAGEERRAYDPMQLSQEPDWLHPDVGICTYSTNLSASHAGRNVFMVFYPKAEEVLVNIGTSGWDVGGDREDPTRGAAAAHIWVFKSAEATLPSLPMPRSAPVAHREGSSGKTHSLLYRRMSVFFPHPWYLFAHCKDSTTHPFRPTIARRSVPPLLSWSSLLRLCEQMARHLELRHSVR